MKKIFLLLFLIVVVILYFLMTRNNEPFQDHNNGYIEACNELNQKRAFLQQYIKYLRAPVQDLSSTLIASAHGKAENMAYQQKLKTKCLQNMTDACKELASVDAYEFEVLPDMDIFFQNLLMGGYSFDSLLQTLNTYDQILNCPINPNSRVTFDISDTYIDVVRDIGEIDTETLALQLENLSPYYLSPVVVQFLLKFLISQEQLNNLNFTSADYINQELGLIGNIHCYYPNQSITNSGCVPTRENS